VVMGVSSVRKVATDEAQKSISVEGTPDQIVLAKWLYNEFDQTSSSTSREYRIPGKPDDVTRVFYLVNPQDPQEVVEAATIARSISGVRLVFVYNARKALVFRGTAAQIALADFLLSEIDKRPSAPLKEHAASAEYQSPDDSGANVVRTFYMAHMASQQDFVEAVTAARTIADLRQAFSYSPQMAVTFRGTSSQIALADWLLRELDQPADIASEYRLPDSKDDVVRVFQIPAAQSQDLKQFTTQIRDESKVAKIFLKTASRSVAVRGTSEQVALAEQMGRGAAVK